MRKPMSSKLSRIHCESCSLLLLLLCCSLFATIDPLKNTVRQLNLATRQRTQKTLCSLQLCVS